LLTSVIFCHSHAFFILLCRAKDLNEMLARLLRTRRHVLGSVGVPDSADMHDIQKNLPVVQSFANYGAGAQSMLSILNELLL
jgi:hypothetical protein